MTNPTKGLGGHHRQSKQQPTTEPKRVLKPHRKYPRPHTIIVRKVHGGLVAENYGGINSGDANNGYEEHVFQNTPEAIAGHFGRYMPDDSSAETEPAEPEEGPEQGGQ